MKLRSNVMKKQASVDEREKEKTLINMFIPCLVCSLTDAEKQVQKEHEFFMARDKRESS